MRLRNKTLQCMPHDQYVGQRISSVSGGPKMMGLFCYKHQPPIHYMGEALPEIFEEKYPNGLTEAQKKETIG